MSSFVDSHSCTTKREVGLVGSSIGFALIIFDIKLAFLLGYVPNQVSLMANN